MSVSLRVAAASMLAAAAFAFSPANAETVHGGYHIMMTPSYIAKTGRNPHLSASNMEYFGGSVFSSSKVMVVFWNHTVLANTKTSIPPFTQALVDSTYVDQMGEYSTKGQTGVTGHGSTNQTIGRGSYLGKVALKPKNTSKNLSDDDIQAELKFQIAQGKLPKNDPNTLYMIYFPSDITITLDGLTSCSSFGAYHFASNDKKMTKKNIFYAVEPECNSGFAFLTFAASHEFAEATTDNIPTPGSNPDFPQAWNDSAGFEIGDKCGGSAKLTAGSSSWTVTQYWLNSLSGCSTKATYTSP